MNPLEKLHDIELPNPVGVWPLAPGWIFLVALLFIIGVIAGFFARHYYLRYRLQRQGLLACNALEEQYRKEGTNVCGSLSVVLRQVALAFHPKERITLKGDEWVNFLKETSQADTWSGVDCRLLTSAPYQLEASTETIPLIEACKRWIKQQG